jgi:hypothetical protein
MRDLPQPSAGGPQVPAGLGTFEVGCRSLLVAPASSGLSLSRSRWMSTKWPDLPVLSIRSKMGGESDLPTTGSCPRRGPVDTPVIGGHMARLPAPGEVAEWLKAADCKSARVSRTLVRIQPSPPAKKRKNQRKIERLPSGGSPSERFPRITIVSGSFPRLQIGAGGSAIH